MQPLQGRWVYILHAEEVPVTFQIGMVGSDGVLLASDTLCTKSGLELGSRNTYNTEKIELNDALGMAYCWAGDDLAGIVVRSLAVALKNPPRHDLPMFIRQAASEALRSALRSNIPTRPFMGGDALIVFSADRSLQLWRIYLQNHPTDPIVMPDRIINRVCTGDAANSAVFFIEQYFPTTPRSIHSLTALAAHVILSAGKLSSGIGGLEVVLCTPSSVRRLDDTELAALAAKATDLEQIINTWLLP